MEKKFFDWADDEELNGKSKVVNMPLMGDIKAEQDLDDLANGFQYSASGMLQKEMAIPLNKERIVYYDPDLVKRDDKGRRYFFGDDGYRHYLTEDNRLYDVRFSKEKGEEEYIVFKGGTILVFKNPEHTIGITDDGLVYRYDASSGTYVYDAQMVIFPTQHR